MPVPAPKWALVKATASVKKLPNTNSGGSGEGGGGGGWERGSGEGGGVKKGGHESGINFQPVSDLE